MCIITDCYTIYIPTDVSSFTTRVNWIRENPRQSADNYFKLSFIRKWKQIILNIVWLLWMFPSNISGKSISWLSLNWRENICDYFCKLSQIVKYVSVEMLDQQASLIQLLQLCTQYYTRCKWQRDQVKICSIFKRKQKSANNYSQEISWRSYLRPCPEETVKS